MDTTRGTLYNTREEAIAAGVDPATLKMVSMEKAAKIAARTGQRFNGLADPSYAPFTRQATKGYKDRRQAKNRIAKQQRKINRKKGK